MSYDLKNSHHIKETHQRPSTEEDQYCADSVVQYLSLKETKKSIKKGSKKMQMI